MIQALIITAISVGADLLMLGGDNNEPPPPAPAVTETPLVPLANALYWVGGCSVACSLIWGTSIVRAAQSRRSAVAGADSARRETNRQNQPMNAILKIVLVALTTYTVGTLVGPVAIGAVQEAKETLSPFLVLSVAVLIGSIDYAVGTVRRSPFAEAVSRT